MVRSDARRNRALLVDAARPAFAEHGFGAALEGVARDAGVGIATLYRHFPTRADLVKAVYVDELDALVLDELEDFLWLTEHSGPPVWAAHRMGRPWIRRARR